MPDEIVDERMVIERDGTTAVCRQSQFAEFKALGWKPSKVTVEAIDKERQEAAAKARAAKAR